MIRSFLITLFAIFLFVPTIHAANPFESTACVSGTMNIVHNSKELLASSLELKGGNNETYK